MRKIIKKLALKNMLLKFFTRLVQQHPVGLFLFSITWLIGLVLLSNIDKFYFIICWTLINLSSIGFYYLTTYSFKNMENINQPIQDEEVEFLTAEKKLTKTPKELLQLELERLK